MSAWEETTKKNHTRIIVYAPRKTKLGSGTSKTLPFESAPNFSGPTSLELDAAEVTVSVHTEALNETRGAS